MDEPDAHLHPSLARQFLQVLQDVFIRKYSVRVIFTTHSPSTIALCPQESIFEIKRGQTHIVRVASRQSAISMLSGGLVTVSAGTKYVLVEDDFDVQVYGALRDLLTDYGTRRDPMALDPATTLVFLSAGSSRGADRIGGGCTTVRRWVDKLDGPPFDELFMGLIDRDQGNEDTPRVRMLARYSIENYILDPLVVYALLLELDIAPAVANVTLAVGDEASIASLPVMDQQAIVEVVCSKVRPQDISAPRHTVKFTNGNVLQYPQWLLTDRGHDLFKVFQSAFGGASNISPPRLLNAFRRVRLIPVELAEIMRALQTYRVV